MEVNICISITDSLKCVPKGKIDNKDVGDSLAMNRRRKLSEPNTTQFTDVIWRHVASMN